MTPKPWYMKFNWVPQNIAVTLHKILVELDSGHIKWKQQREDHLENSIILRALEYCLIYG